MLVGIIVGDAHVVGRRGVGGACEGNGFSLSYLELRDDKIDTTRSDMYEATAGCLSLAQRLKTVSNRNKICLVAPQS